jgi:hypothetical protein
MGPKDGKLLRSRSGSGILSRISFIHDTSPLTSCSGGRTWVAAREGGWGGVSAAEETRNLAKVFLAYSMVKGGTKMKVREGGIARKLLEQER